MVMKVIGCKILIHAKFYAVFVATFKKKKKNLFFSKNHNIFLVIVFNRPSVAGAVLQTPLSLIHSLIGDLFSFKSSKHHKSQTIRARELTFWENVYPPPHVTCHMSHVTCHVSCVTCRVWHVTFFLLSFFTNRWSLSVEDLLSMGQWNLKQLDSKNA